jgi:hypothetical protein
MDVKYANIFHCKILQNLPELGFGLKLCIPPLGNTHFVQTRITASRRGGHGFKSRQDVRVNIGPFIHTLQRCCLKLNMPWYCEEEIKDLNFFMTIQFPLMSNAVFTTINTRWQHKGKKHFGKKLN